MTTQKDCSKSNELFKIQSLSESIGLLIEFKHCFAHSSTYGLFNIIIIIKNQFKIPVNNPSILNGIINKMLFILYYLKIIFSWRKTF
jgi:hypothetical protein